MNLDSTSLRSENRSDLLTARMVPTLANFADEFVFVSGGQDPAYESVLSSVHKYDIVNDRWTQAPALSRPRVGHASCTLNDKLYVFCGGVVSTNASDEASEPYPDNSIESLNVRALIDRVETVTWQVITLKNAQNGVKLTPRFLPVVSSLNTAEIVILGGDSSIEGVNMILGDAHIFDTEALTMEAVSMHESSLQFQSSSNISVTCRENQIGALVMDAQGKLHLISYVKNEDKVQVVKRLV